MGDDGRHERLKQWWAGAATAALAWGLAAGLGAGSAAAEETRLSLTSGFDYSVGDYGLEEDTTLIAIPLSLRAKRGAWFVRASAAWLQVDGPAIIDDGMATPATLDIGQLSVDAEQCLAFLASPEAAERPFLRNQCEEFLASQPEPGDTLGEAAETISGFGDTTLSLGRNFEWGGTAFTLTGGVKLPTGDEEDGLSTGSTDYSLRGSLEQPLGDTLYAALDVGYKIRGDRDDEDAFAIDNGAVVADTAEPRDTLSATAELGAYWSGGWSTAVQLDWAQSSIEDTDDTLEAGLTLSKLLNRRTVLLGYGYAGLDGPAADFGGGLALSFTLTP